jgi:hypothetical protein
VRSIISSTNVAIFASALDHNRGAINRIGALRSISLGVLMHAIECRHAYSAEDGANELERKDIVLDHTNRE